jgi:phosphonate transport system permease protein
MKPGSEKSTEKKLEKSRSAESSGLGPDLFRAFEDSKKKRLFAYSFAAHFIIIAAALLAITASSYASITGSSQGFWSALSSAEAWILTAGAFFLSWIWTRSPWAILPPLVKTSEKLFGIQVDEGMSLLEFRVRVEKQKTWFAMVFINSVSIFYFVGGIYYLAAEIYEATELVVSTVAYIGLGSLFLGALWTRSANSIGRTIVERTNSVLKSVRKADDSRWMTSPAGIFSVTLMLFTLYAGFLVTKIDMIKLFSAKGLQGAANIFGSLVQPDWSIVPAVINSMVETIFIALMATLIAVPIAFATSFLIARNLMKGAAWSMAVYNFFRIIFNFSRSVEPLVWAIIFSVWVGVGPFAGMMALMLHSVASLAKLYSEQIEGVDRGPIEAIEATGANRVVTIWYAVVPQIILPYVSFTIYRWDINVRMATVIGLVGGGGIGNLLNLYMLQARWYQVGTIVLAIAIVVWILDYLSAKIREAVY